MKIENREVPLDRAVSLIALAADDSLSVSDLLVKFDELAGSVDCATPTQLMNSLFGIGKFTGNSVEYDDPANSLMNHVFARHLGIPITLCVLAVEIGSRVGIPINAIGMPGHFLCYGPSPFGEQGAFFDPFHGPDALSASDCQALYRRLTSLDNWSAEFLKATPSRQVVVRMLNNLKSIYMRRGDVAAIRWVMRLRTAIPEIATREDQQFARLVRASN